MASKSQALIKVFQIAAEKQAPILEASGIKQEMLVRVLTNAMVGNPKLADCTQNSITQAVYKCAEDGLLPNGTLAAIVPFQMKGALVATYIPMVGGLLAKARAAYPQTAFNADVALKTDQWEDVRGSEPRIVHIPNPKGTSSPTINDILAVYATAHHRDNAQPEAVVIYGQELIEKFAKKNRGPWSQWPLEMAKARALKRLLKRLPSLASIPSVLEDAEEDYFDGTTIDAEAATVMDDPPPTQRRQRISKPKQEKPAPEPEVEETEPETEPEPDDIEDDGIPVMGDDDGNPY